jgi:hypothetical protein
MRRLTPQTFPKVTITPVPEGVQASAQLVSQQALHAMTMNKALHAPDLFTPQSITNKSYKGLVPNYAHFALPMVHPTTGETINSYKCSMHDQATVEVWQTAFGKDFGGMAQGNNKTGQKGTNSVFFMTWKEIDVVKANGAKWTYTRIVIDF